MNHQTYLRETINDLLSGISVIPNRDAAGPYAEVLDLLMEIYDPGDIDRFRSSLEALKRKHSGIKQALEKEDQAEQGYIYQLHPLGYFRERAKRNWGVEELVYDRGSSLFVGDGGCGKSAFALNMYMSRVCEVPFLGKYTKPAFLIWVAAESIDDVYPRAVAMLGCLGISVKEAEKKFWILDGRVPFNNVAEVDLFCKETEEQLHAIGVTKETHTIVFVFDTYAKCTPDANENDTQETKNITDSIDFITRAFDGHVTIIHHSNAAGKSRGSTALRNHVDTCWQVSKDGNKMKLHCDKMRGSREPEDFFAEMRSIVLDESNPFDTAPVIFPLDTQQEQAFTPAAEIQLLKVLDAYGELSCNQWALHSKNTYGIAERTFHNLRESLCTKKLVTIQGEKVRGKKTIYIVTEAGRDILK